MGNHDVDSRNERGQTLVGFPKDPSPKFMNTFFDKEAHEKWTRKLSSGVKNEEDFILTEESDITKNMSSKEYMMIVTTEW